MQKPRTAAEQAADVIEHALATDGEDYLGTAEHLYTWWQLALLDVYAVIAAAVLALLGVASGLAWLLWRICRALLRRGLGNSKLKTKTT